MRIINRRFAISIVTSVLFFWVGCAPVSAHVEASNNGVSAVMHILPDDNPTAGGQTFLQFLFGGSNKDFTVQTCGCELTANDGSITRQAGVGAADAAATDNGIAVITFPQEGVYDLTLTGKAGARAFAIPYVVRVGNPGQSLNISAAINVGFITAASLIILGLIAHYNIREGRRYAVSKRSQHANKNK